MHTHSRPATLLLSLQPPLMEGLQGICTAAPAHPEPPCQGHSWSVHGTCVSGRWGPGCPGLFPALGLRASVRAPQPRALPAATRPALRPHLRPLPAPSAPRSAGPEFRSSLSALRGVGGAVSHGLQGPPHFSALAFRAGHRAWGPRPGAHAAALGVEGDQGRRASGPGVSTRAEGVESRFPGTGGPGVTGGLAGPGEPPVLTRDRQWMGGASRP